MSNWLCRFVQVRKTKYSHGRTTKKQRLRLEEVYIIFKNVYLYILQLPKVGLVSGQRRRCSRISVYIQVSMTTTRTCMSYRLGGFDSSKLICASNRQSSQKWSIENSWNFKPKRICWDTHLGQQLASYKIMCLIGKKDSPWIILNPGSASNHIKSFKFDKTEQKTLQGNVDEIIRDQRRFAGLPPYLKNIATN